MKRCFSCFSAYDEAYSVCPHCGKAQITEPLEPIHLLPGTVIADRYIIGQAVGAGGFGIVYKAWDTKLETVIAVKEFFVSRLMTRAEGLKTVIVTKKSQAEYIYRKERFLAEARNMAKFGTHRSIPNVFEYFEENNTAYIVMELLQGMTLKEYFAQKDEVLGTGFALQIANEVGNALMSLHQENIIHRDVAPDNIFISTGKELRIKLMDMGAARLADSTDDVIDIILKPGYSPPEQYDNSKNIGPWSDVYAFGATLYMLMTGIKPDESTNRKINDTVVPPHQIDSSIPENLSNAIMKAMAVEKHMRFQTVDSFLKALNGKRKVPSLCKEKRTRRVRRGFGIAVASLVLMSVSFMVGWSLLQKHQEQTIPAASIVMWCLASGDSAKAEAMRTVLADFRENFPQVRIDLCLMAEEEYALALEAAVAEGRLPTLFESTGVDERVLELAADVGAVLASEQAGECYFLEQYDAYYPQRKQIPLAIEVPLAYVVTNGATQIEYTEDYFSDLSDFGAKVNISADSSCSRIIAKNFGSRSFASKETFLDNSENTSPVLLSSTMHLNEVRTALTNYGKRYVFYNAAQVQCDFIYEWSIGNGTAQERQAAETLLSWLLGNPYQSVLMISQSSEGEIPINATAFAEKIKTSSALAPIETIRSKCTFQYISAIELEQTQPEEVVQIKVEPPADVAESSYYYDAVLWAVERGVIQGGSDARFNPSALCSRAQAVTLIWRAAGSQTPKMLGNPYSDVPEESFFRQAAVWACENGLTDNGLFYPEQTVNRAQLTTLLYRLLGEEVTEQIPFDDVPEDSYYYAPAVWAYDKKIVSATHSFDPDGVCSRAAAITFIYRAFSAVEK